MKIIQSRGMKPYVVMYCDHCNKQKRYHEVATLACPIGERRGTNYERFHPSNTYLSERKKQKGKFAK